MERDLPSVREPRQNRSRRTLARIVDSARRLLADEGVDAVTVQAVVAKAGASVGSFYARFSGKDDLLVHLQEAVWADVGAWLDGAVAEVRWEARSLDETAEQVVQLLSQSRNVHSAERRSLRARPAGWEGERRFEQRMRETLRAGVLAGAAGKTISHPDPPLALELALRAVSGVLRDLDEGSSSDADRATVERELRRLFVAYLGARPSTAGSDAAPKGVDYFDVWG